MQTDIAAGYKIPNISYSDSEAKMILIYGGIYAKVLQYIFKDSRTVTIPFAGKSERILLAYWVIDNKKRTERESEGRRKGLYESTF